QELHAADVQRLEALGGGGDVVGGVGAHIALGDGILDGRRGQLDGLRLAGAVGGQLRQDGAVGGVGDADPGPLDGRRVIAHGDHHLQGPSAYVCRIHNGIPPFRILVYAPTGPAVPSGVGGTTRQGVRQWSISSNTEDISSTWSQIR